MFHSPLFRRYVSLLLLLLLGRVWAPESMVLLLHDHAHTQDEPTRAPAAPKGKALLTVKHQHCHVDQLYDVPVLPAAPVLVPVPAARPVFAVRATAPVPGLPVVAVFERAGRGPPSA
ncbi:hypothetical protein LJY25_17190 [Hymenobacter sp. BT175]|uniref:hypothetical protein n=1 Tax=Hymenobacter translucens TaxID=2886507 RepID=UPI001D0E8DAC|nr:hypothetical protein [Hymenobacter translucens]MCC2548188.1 hypothetical protein [Hymenobacter translucens]